MILAVLFLYDFTAAARTLSTLSAGFTAVEDTCFFVAFINDGAAAGRANLFCHQGISSGYLSRLYALYWRGRSATFVSSGLGWLQPSLLATMSQLMFLKKAAM